MESIADFNKTLGLNITGTVDQRLYQTIGRLYTLIAGQANAAASATQKQATAAAAAAAATAKTAQAQRAATAQVTQAAAAQARWGAYATQMNRTITQTAQQMNNAASAAQRMAAYIQNAQLRGQAMTRGGALRALFMGQNAQQVQQWGQNLTQMTGGRGFGGAVGGFMTQYAPAIGAAMTAAQAIGQAIENMRMQVMIAGYLFLRISRTIHQYWSQIVQQILNAGKAFAALSVKAVQQAGSFEMLQGRLEAVFGTQAPKMLKEIVGWAEKVPFTIDDMTEAFIRLKAGGVADTLGNIGRAFKASSDLAVTFGTDVVSAGKALQGVYAGRMDRMTRGYGIRAPQLEPYGAVLKPGTGSLESSPENRAKNLLAAVRFIEANFGTATERLAYNLNQLLTNVKDLWLKFSLALKETGITDIVGAVVLALMDLYKKLDQGGVIGGWAETIKNAYAKLQPLVLQLLQAAPYVVGQAISTFESIYQRVVDLYDRLGGVDEVYRISMIVLQAADRIAAALVEIVPTLRDMLPPLVKIFGGMTQMVLGVWSMILGTIASVTNPEWSNTKSLGVMGAMTALGGPLGQATALPWYGLQTASKSAYGSKAEQMQSVGALQASIATLSQELGTLMSNTGQGRPGIAQILEQPPGRAPVYAPLGQYAGWRKPGTAATGGTNFSTGVGGGVPTSGRLDRLTRGYGIDTDDLVDGVRDSTYEGTYNGTKDALSDMSGGGDAATSGGRMGLLTRGFGVRSVRGGWPTADGWGPGGRPAWEGVDAAHAANNARIASEQYGMSAEQLRQFALWGELDTMQQNSKWNRAGIGRGTSSVWTAADYGQEAARARVALHAPYSNPWPGWVGPAAVGSGVVAGYGLAGAPGAVTGGAWGATSYFGNASAYREDEMSYRQRRYDAAQTNANAAYANERGVTIIVDARGSGDPAAVEAAARRGAQAGARTLNSGGGR